MSEPRVTSSVFCEGREIAPRTSLINNSKQHTIVLILGDASIYLSQAQAADISLALSRAISDVDRAKGAAVVREVEPYCVQVMDLVRSRHAKFDEALVEAKKLSDQGARHVSIFNSDRVDGSIEDGVPVYHDGLTQDERDAFNEVL